MIVIIVINDTNNLAPTSTRARERAFSTSPKGRRFWPRLVSMINVLRNCVSSFVSTQACRRVRKHIHFGGCPPIASSDFSPIECTRLCHRSPRRLPAVLCLTVRSRAVRGTCRAVLCRAVMGCPVPFCTLPSSARHVPCCAILSDARHTPRCAVLCRAVPCL